MDHNILHQSSLGNRNRNLPSLALPVLIAFFCVGHASLALAGDLPVAETMHDELMAGRPAERGPQIRYAVRPTEKPALRIRPRQPGDLLQSLGLAEPMARVDAALPKVEEAIFSGANVIRASWSKFTVNHPPNGAPPQEINDPFETINRLSFGLNRGLQQQILEPVSEYYLDHTSVAVRKSVRNFFANLREPLSIASYALEGDINEAGNATARFAINTTVGIGGLFDKAEKLGFPKNPRDLEATACAYGIPAGPYVVLPILGPATMRDAAVRVTTMAMYLQAMGLAIYIPYRGTGIAVQYADIRDKQDFVESISLDPYIAYRMLYTQMRKQNCGHGTDEDQYFTR